MRWSILLKLTDSKAFWSLNLLIILVPLIARFGMKISYDLFFLYIAAFLLLTAGTLVAVFKPVVIQFRDHGHFVSTANDLCYLRELYESLGGNLDEMK